MTLGVVLLTSLLAGCGSSNPAGPGPVQNPGTPNPGPQAPPPVPPPPDLIEFVSSTPPPNGIIHTGLPDPAVTLASGPTSGLTISFRVTSGIDRAARLRLYLSGPAHGICLANTAPVPLVPLPPVLQLRAGVPVIVTMDRLQMTSVCRYPYAVTIAQVYLIEPTGDASFATIFAQYFIELPYTVVE